jgi:hypothetical protein
MEITGLSALSGQARWKHGLAIYRESRLAAVGNHLPSPKPLPPSETASMVDLVQWKQSGSIM